MTDWLLVKKNMIKKIITDILNLNNISKYKVDGLIINPIDYSTFSGNKFEFTDIVKINDFCKKNNVYSLVCMDRIFLQSQIKEVFLFLDKLLKLEIDYIIFSDFSILTFFSKKETNTKLIYKPNTLITNKSDASFYKKRQISFFISNEISLDEMLEINKLSSFSLEVYGHHPIFYSKREVLKNYSDYLDDSTIVLKTRYLKEELRDDLYPIYESDKSCIIYSAKKIAITKELNQFDKIDFFKINSDFIDENTLFNVIKLYNNYQTGAIKLGDFEKQLDLIDNNTENLFLYNKTYLLQKGNENEKD